MKVFLKISSVLIAIALIVDIVASFYFYNLAIARTKKDFLTQNTTLKQAVPASAEVATAAKFSMSTEVATVVEFSANTDNSAVAEFSANTDADAVEEFSDNTETSAVAEFSANTGLETQIDWFNKHTYEEVGIISDDGLKLKGYYLNAKIPTSKTVILAHGYSSQGIFMGSYAKLYNEELGYNVLLPDDRGHGDSEGNYTGFGWLDRKDYLKWIDFVINKLGPDS